MTTVIREFQDGDADAVVTLWHAAGISRPWNDPARDIAFARRDPHSTILLIERDAAVAATAMVGEDGHRGWVYYVAVDPRLRDLGLGRAIMEAAERWLVARGVWKVQLLVREENRATRHFYEHLGYRDTRTICLQKVIGDTAG
ncbi:GNAT family acetyltransferase [Methylobacterium sp. Leaf93]|uniref:GNAT family acetyltransferase n=1 Tax=Methylobacterium sp. Leaf93 TaxID=1736249 RepID=UPI0006F4051D|nr:GNAT family acetyltransferase [Methylobacterium sp. Leaf93]KQP05711.1 acetyltransferase [Methylobacterium sp. Leaf93]